MKQRVTIDDVAKAAGVSKQTVSRAINDKGEIHPATKARILELVNTMGYRPSRLAQALNTQRTYMVGLVLQDITNPFFPEMARGVQDTALAHDYSALIVNTDEKAELELGLLNMLVAQGVDGLITFTHHAPDKELTKFADTFRPMVLINRLFEHPHVNLLLIDNKKGAESAVDYLFLLGHRHIGMLSNAQFFPGQVRRVQGYKSALVKHALPVREEYIEQESANLAGGYRAATSLLGQQPELTALFCYNDLMALGAIRACRDIGRRVPEDISIIGFDDIQLATMNSPAVTSISVDKYELGRLAFKRLLALIEDPHRPVETIHMGVELVIRESTAPLNQT